MGNWNITIQGVGCHRRLASDANRLAAKFVQELRDAGHNVQHACFTYGGTEAIDGGAKYLETRDEIEKDGAP